MTKADDVPEWAMERAKKLALQDGCNGNSWVAFARHIAAHEQPPVDPIQRLAAEICAKLRGTGSSAKMVKEVEAMLRARSVTLGTGGE